MSETPPAGWYPDPQEPDQVRYWDGQQWTEHRSPARQQLQPAPQPPQLSGTEANQAAAGKHAATDKPASKVPLFGARGHARKIAGELQRANAEVVVLRDEMERLGVLDLAQLERERERLRDETTRMQDELRQARASLEREIADLKGRVVKTQEAEILQEVGIYEYRHPLSDSVAYKAELAKLQDRIKTMARKDGGAINADSGWTVNGSQAQGRKMINDYSKLMLRAYNAEADNLVRGMKPYKLDSAVDRLSKVTATIERLGKTMSIQVARQYHQLRIKELELTADYQEKLAREKDEEREERARLREQRKLEQEIAREKTRLDKERQHYQNALQALIDKGDDQGAERVRSQLADVDKAIEDIDYRAANARAGYVYVISNLGAFGERMVKVGMTRRLDPMDRIRELSDASVPFNFDIHALFFADDAVTIESEMHQRMADRRVNRVNLRREFFYASPAEAREHLMALTGELLSFEETPEAIEFHQSLHAASGREAMTV